MMENIEKAWVARNETDGDLYMYFGQPPVKEETPRGGFWTVRLHGAPYVWIDKRMLPEVTYENSPMKVELTIKPVIKVWIARDWDGGLFSYKEKPRRQEVDRMWLDSPVYQDYKYDGIGCLEQLDNKLYPDLKWEDEPIEVEI